MNKEPIHNDQYTSAPVPSEPAPKKRSIPKAVAILIALALLVGGGTVYGFYKQANDKKMAADNQSSAQKYLADRNDLRKKYESINYAEESHKQNLTVAENVALCNKLNGVVESAKSVKEFDDNGYAKDDKSVISARTLREKYPVDKVTADIKNISDLCKQQIIIVEYVTSMNNANAQLPKQSQEYYQKSADLSLEQAKKIASSCPYTYVSDKGQAICDHNVNRAKKYAEANQLVANAMKAGGDINAASSKAKSLYDEANKGVDPSVYKAVLGEESTDEDFSKKYFAMIGKRIQQL